MSRTAPLLVGLLLTPTPRLHAADAPPAALAQGGVLYLACDGNLAPRYALGTRTLEADTAVDGGA